MKTLFALLLSTIAGLTTALSPVVDAPQTEISNGLIKAQLYLPDAQTGYYRGTRFDWGGQVSALTYNGHSFFGNWNDRPYDPILHDAIMGPVEEFGVLGFDNAKPGGTFVQIGVGTLTRPDDKPHNRFGYYPIVNHGRWQVKKKGDQVQFRHTLSDSTYAYDYQKTLKLVKGKPELLITHSLKNTGSRPIETTSYNHNFFMIDNQPTGPTYTITFPTSDLSAEGSQGYNDIVKTQNNQLLYLREQRKGNAVFFANMGGGKPIPYRLVIDNSKAKAGVRITGDQEINRMVYWSSPTTVCPEPYIKFRIEPGKTFNWQIRYEFYTNP